MSYDFHLGIPRDGETLDEMAERVWDSGQGASSNPEADVRRRELAEALVMSSPKLELFIPDPEEYARQASISLDEAKKRCNYWELNVPEDDPSGIQIEIYEEGVSISIPFWHVERAFEFMREVWGYLEVIERHAGYKTFDPQLERLLDLSSDFEEVATLYRGVAEGWLEHIANQAQPKKPWWKFW